MSGTVAVITGVNEDRREDITGERTENVAQWGAEDVPEVVPESETAVITGVIEVLRENVTERPEIMAQVAADNVPEVETEVEQEDETEQTRKRAEQREKQSNVKPAWNHSSTSVAWKRIWGSTLGKHSSAPSVASHLLASLIYSATLG